MEHERLSDMPAPLRWTMIFIKQLGFPVAICFYLMYQQYVGGKETVLALHEFKEVLIQVKDILQQQNYILRRNIKDE